MRLIVKRALVLLLLAPLNVFAADVNPIVSLNPTGVLLRGSTTLPGTIGYAPSFALGIQFSRFRLTASVGANVAAPTPISMSGALRFTGDFLRFDLGNGIDVAGFIGAQALARFLVPGQPHLVPTAVIGARLLFVEFAFGGGAEFPLLANTGITWNLDSLSVSIDFAALIRFANAGSAGERLHGVAPP